MAGSTRRDLYLAVNGDVRGLQTAMKAGRTVVNEFGGTAIDVVAEVERAFGQFSAKGLDLRAMEKAADASFARIRANAQALATAPSGQAAVQLLDANATREAAAAAEQKAAAFRLVAEAANRADQAQQGLNPAVRAYAAGAAAAAIEAEGEARALRDQAAALGLVENQLEQTSTAQRRQMVVSGQTRAGYQQLGYQLNDVAVQYASGASASIIFAQQSGQVIQALQLIGGEGNKVLQFLGGGWGIAISSALVFLTPFVAKLLEGGDALEKETEELEKNAEKSRVAEQAKKAFASTEAGLANDVRELTAELEKQNDALKTNAERLNIRAKKQVSAGEQLRPGIAKEVADARQEVEAARVAEAGGAEGALGRALSKLAVAETKLKAIDGYIAQAKANVLATRADLADEAAERAADPVKAKLFEYNGANGLIAQAKARAKAEGTVTAELTKQLTLLRQKRDAEVAELQKKKSGASATANRQFGREIDLAGATAIITGIGGRVTSGYRSTDEQARIYADKLAGRHNGPVAKPGTSAHERGEAIDVAFGPGIDVASIRKAFADAGVSLRKVLREEGQKVFHVEFGKGGRSGPSADTLARREEAEADRKVRNADEYASLLSRVKGEQLQLERGRVLTISEAADLDRSAVDRQLADVERAAQKGVELDKWTQAEADAVKLIARQNAETEKQTITQRERSRQLDRELETDRARIRDGADLLRLQADQATTQKERRRIALQILALEEEERRRVALRMLASNDPDVRADGKRELAAIDAQRPYRVAQIESQTAGPLDDYFRRLRGEAGDLQEALQGVAVNGLGAFEDESTRAISSLIKVKGAFGGMVTSILADFARLQIRRGLLSLLGGLGLGGSKAPAAPTVGQIGDLLAKGYGGPRAKGGGIDASKWYLVGEEGPELFAPGLSGSIIPNSALRAPALPSAASLGSGGSGGVTTVRLALSGDIDARIDGRAAGVAVEVVRSAAPALVQAATDNTLSTLNRPGM